MASGVINKDGLVSLPQDSHPNALDAAVRGQLKLMLRLDITVIPITVTDITTALVMDMDMLSPDTATLMSAASWERGQLRLMPNLDITVILMDFMDIPMDSTDTVVLLPPSRPEAPKA